VEWVLSGLLGVLVYTLRAMRKRDAAQASAARLRNLPREEGEVALATPGDPERGTPVAGPSVDGSRSGPGPAAPILQPRPRVLRIREESDR
jgi:hypothetical protein